MADVVGLVMAGAAGLGLGLSKGLLPWLKSRKASGDHCTDHEKRISRVETVVKGHAQEFGKGSVRFQRIETMVGRIDKNVAVLLDRDDRKGVEVGYGER